METGACQAGYYCLVGSTWAFDSTHYCGIGQYCPTGTANLESATCEAGYYQPNALQSTCYPCLKGFYCPAGVQYDLALNYCPKGYYCPTGTSSPTQYPCPVGTYNDHIGATSAVECVISPPGYFIKTTATTVVTLNDQCEAGYYCAAGSTDSKQSKCQPGYYCPKGSAIPILCTAGYACKDSAMSAPSASDKCNEGTYCSQGATSVAGTTCPKGYYCPLGSAAPTPCPAGTYNSLTGKVSSSDCLTCPEGFGCPTHAMTAVGPQCTAGFYCPAGSTTTTVKICPAGNYCPTGSILPTACSSNLFQDETGSSACKQCPAGHICTSTTTTKCTPQLEGSNYYCTGGSSMVKTPCPSGTYNYFDGSDSLTDCWSCPPGSFCPSNVESANLKIQICPSGSYCLEGVDSPTTCIAGFYCPEGTNVPIPCPNGMYCDKAGLTTPTGICSAGYICLIQNIANAELNALCINYVQTGCVIGQLSPTPSDSICPAGYYCQAGTIIPLPCPIGSYNPSTGKDDISDCIICPAGSYCYMAGSTAIGFECEAGYYCTQGSKQQTQEECPQGSFCPASSIAPILCPKGTYQPDEVQQNCVTCENGWYCSGTGLTFATICPVGHYCNSADGSTITPLPCPKGTFSNLEGLSSITQCQSCPYGKYCDSTGMTAPGQASDCNELKICYDPDATEFTSSQMNEQDCVARQICAKNTIVPKICGPGTYSDATEASNVYNCITCPVDKYCPDWGLTTETLSQCPDGYICLGGAIHPSKLDGVTIKLCPAGSRCKLSEGIRQELCPVHYFNPSIGQTECQTCNAGFFCLEKGLINPLPCPAGSYCPVYDAESEDTGVIPCPAGTYSPNKYLILASQCISCPPGKYCVGGQTTFTGLCAAGYICTGGQSTPTPSGTFAFTDYSTSYSGPCPVGYYCPYGSSYPRPCAAGYYQDQTGQSSCKACTTGYYCPQRGLAAPVRECANGFYCIKGSIHFKPFDFQTGRICATGHYCKNGLEYQCEDGRYAPVNGLDQCYDCPPGYYCNNVDGTITPLQCIPGHYCPAKTATPNKCPNGTYTQNFGLERQDQCSACPTGYYCTNGLLNETQMCNAGYYCISGASKPNQDELKCPMGYFCTRGTKLPTACPVGKYAILGAKSEDDCKDCSAGFYCVRYIKSYAMIECPAGYYCPAAVEKPIACPVGTYNVNTKQKSLDRCLSCPEGTVCDVTGISDYSRKLCPPGHYCPLQSITPTPCPAGTFRPSQGGAKPGPLVWSLTTKQAVAACFSCVPGYYCPAKATVVPEVCPRGKFCPLGSNKALDCPPGYYCFVNSERPKICPPGFYCIGSSDVYIKCPSGSYCPSGSKAPIKCPDGMYGSGNNDNFDLESGCLDQGRGVYSKDDPTKSFDCAPGYVCTGRTTSKTPMNATQGGYQCPIGYYCPKGSFSPQPCPVGTYSKYPGAESIQKCLPCKENWYNDLPGQEGCNQCGPTSYSNAGADTCICIGANRNFVKSLGSCLCATGYKLQVNGTNVNSTSDCVPIARIKCVTTKQFSLTGECLDADQQVQECNKQCPGVGGKMITGTGLCQCDQIADISEVCDSTCQNKMPQITLGNDGKMSVKDPVTGKTTQIDPSTIPGYYGDFKCQTKSSCKVQTIGITDDGSFTYEFQPNLAILKATNIPNNTQFSTPVVRFQKLKAQGRTLTTVEESSVPRLKNPAICIQAGDIVFFNVVPKTLNYPVFYKDSILNQNADKFDYGPFINLEKMIIKGVDVSTFSYVFSHPGNFLFQNKASGTITTISVVDISQQCGGSDGVFVSMVTEQALTNMKIQSKEKLIRPDWWFISIQIIGIVSFVFFVMGLFILAHNKNLKGSNLLFEAGKNSKENSIYYDRAKLNEQDATKPCCFGLCRVRPKKVYNKKEDSSDSSDEALIGTKYEYAIKYKDLENLLADFNRAQEVLNRQLIDTEKIENRFIQENSNLIKKQSNEEALLSEIQRLFNFVKNTRSTLNTALNAIEEQENAEIIERNKNQNSEIDGLNSELTKKVANQFQDFYKQNLLIEMAFSGQLEQQTKVMQNKALEQENVRNDCLKQKLLDEYQQRLTDSTVNERDREALLAEFHAKLSNINDLAAQEQERQYNDLKQMQERRKQKKDKFQMLLNNLFDKKKIEDDNYQQKLKDIQQRYNCKICAIDDEIEEFRQQSISSIQDQLYQKRIKSVSEQEKRLEIFKRKRGKGYNPEADLIFADMLKSYGNHVKKLDDELAKEKEHQVAKLEENLKDRKQARLKKIEKKKKQKEQMLSTETGNINNKLIYEMKQLESLLYPIKDEQARMEIILKFNKNDEKVIQTVEYQPIQLSQVSQTAIKEITQIDTKSILSMLNQIDVENEIKRREIEQHKEILNRQIANCLSDDERYRLIKQLEAYENNLQQKLAQQQEIQSQNLKVAIEARKHKCNQAMQQVIKEKSDETLKMFRTLANNKVLDIQSPDQLEQLVQRILAGFSKDEAIQVTENYLDQKNQQEIIILMNSLFQERAEALRKFIFDLLSQKQIQFALLSNEFEPQKEFLRQKRVKQLLSLENFTAAFERLTLEETERHYDIEIAFADKEKQLKQELELLKIETEIESIKSLKDRQTKERRIMFGEMIKLMDDKDQMKSYLTNNIADLQRETEQYKLLVDKEKTQKIIEVKKKYKRKMKELLERQERLVNVEEQIKKDETKYMERFKRQREEMIARKLADQQRDLLNEMSQKEINEMLERHKHDLKVMDDVLAEEQSRQMEIMLKRIKERNTAKAREQRIRQIKLAEIQQAKTAEMEMAKHYQAAGGDLSASQAQTQIQQQISRLVEKASLMQRVTSKQCYSYRVFFKRHIVNQQKLNTFLERNILTDWLSIKSEDLEDATGQSALSLKTQDFREQLSEERITYSVLLQHIESAEQHYDAVRKNQ